MTVLIRIISATYIMIAQNFYPTERYSRPRDVAMRLLGNKPLLQSCAAASYLLPTGCTKFSQFGFCTLITVQWPMEQTSILPVKFADCPVARQNVSATAHGCGSGFWYWSLQVSTWLQEIYFGNESPFETTWYMVAWNIPALPRGYEGLTFPRGYPTRLLGPCFYVSGTYVPTWLPHQVARASFPCACIRDLRSHVVKTFVQVMCFPNYRFIPHPVRAVQATYVICSPYPLGYFPYCLLLWWYFSCEQKSLVSLNQKVRISQHTVLSSLSLQPKTCPNSTLQSRNLFSCWYILTSTTTNLLTFISVFAARDNS